MPTSYVRANHSWISFKYCTISINSAGLRDRDGPAEFFGSALGQTAHDRAKISARPHLMLICAIHLLDWAIMKLRIHIRNVGTLPATMLSSESCRYVHPLLAIPITVQAEIFPDKSLSVLAFLEFPFPTISVTVARQNTSEFFSRNYPNIEATKDIQNVPIPSAQTLTDLVATCTPAALSGMTSIKCLHVPSGSKKMLPIWAITYWAEVLSCVQQLVRPGSRLKSSCGDRGSCGHT